MSRSIETATTVVRSESESQTLAVAASLASHLKGGDLVALEGPLGSGKTCFVRGLAIGLGIDPALVSSPTFVIRHEYGRGSEATASTLVHIDAYRLASSDELETIGWSELLEDQTAVVAVEWPSRIAASLPANRIDVTLKHVNEHTRQITVIGPAWLLHQLNMETESAQSSMTSARCRTCGLKVNPTAATFPFCSDRCRMADLGRWFNETYRTSRAAESDDELTE